MLERYQRFKPFKEDEAWLLFRLAAFGEAAGWTLLISGLMIEHFITPKSDIPVLLAGQTHGILFLIYIAASIILAPSLAWSLKKTVTAGLFSIPPYGSLMFEIWAGHQRQNKKLRTINNFAVYQKLLASG